MMQSDILHPSGPYYDVFNSTTSLFGQHDLSNMGTQMDDYDFSSLLTMFDDPNPFHSILFSNDFAAQVPPFDGCLQFGSVMEGVTIMDFEGYHDLFLNDQHSPDQSVTRSDESTNITSTPDSSVSFPEESMIEIDDSQLSIRHLLKAYGEATEKGQKELAQVILNSLAEKASPFGDTLERLAFNIITHDREVNEYDYLRQESLKNFDTAFKAFYQIFPYGKFAHFAANSAILEAVPDDADTIHIVDFDIGDGLQWPPVIEALARKQRTLTITAIKWEEEEEEEGDDNEEDEDDLENQRKRWVFEETGKKLTNHGENFGLNLKVGDVNLLQYISHYNIFRLQRYCIYL